MTTVNDLIFKVHPDGNSFESQKAFDNNHAISVICGPPCYNLRFTGDVEPKENALDYTTFEYYIWIPGHTGPESQDWKQAVSIEALNLVLLNTEAREFIAASGGGTGTTTSGAGE